MRLPTEAEWEYSSKAGKSTFYCSGNTENNLQCVGWYDANSNGAPHKVEALLPNSFGLFDMHGNVREWCQDWYGPYSSENLIDPHGPTSGADRVTRGGGFISDQFTCRSTHRLPTDPNLNFMNDIGFRIVIELPRSAP